jgi:hypothetical protein
LPDPCPECLLTIEVDNDLEWENGFVRVPSAESGLGRWPHSIYAHDMAKAFVFMSLGTEESLSEHFERVFQGTPWPGSNWHKQVKIWQSVTDMDREITRHMPRTLQGLWTMFHKTIK